MANVSWQIGHYDLNGFGISTNYSSYVAGEGSTNQILHSTNRQLDFLLNSVDQLQMSVYLDDPVAYQLKRLKSIAKVWRTVRNDAGSIIYQDPSNQPCFAGILGYTKKSGSQNIMQCIFYNPFWRVQTHFHILNHYLKTNPATSSSYTQSEMVWKLIKLINEAFGIAISGTGIKDGTFYDNGSEVTVAPFFVPKGSYTWPLISDNLLSRAGSIDLIPRYFHADGDPNLMFLDTALKRGSDRSGSTNFRYHTGTGDNLDDFEEEEQVVPTEFANYVWAVGQGGPNSGKIAVARNDSSLSGSNGMQELGIYMRRADYESEKRLGVADDGNGNPTHLKADAITELELANDPHKTYTAALSPAGGTYYGAHFVLGDVIRMDANKNALQVSNLKQRIYEAHPAMSDNNVETVNISIANDFYGKVTN